MQSSVLHFSSSLVLTLPKLPVLVATDRHTPIFDLLHFRRWLSSFYTFDFLSLKSIQPCLVFVWQLSMIKSNGCKAYSGRRSFYPTLLRWCCLASYTQQRGRPSRTLPLPICASRASLPIPIFTQSICHQSPSISSSLSSLSSRRVRTLLPFGRVRVLQLCVEWLKFIHAQGFLLYPPALHFDSRRSIVCLSLNGRLVRAHLCLQSCPQRCM